MKDKKTFVTEYKSRNGSRIGTRIEATSYPDARRQARENGKGEVVQGILHEPRSDHQPVGICK